MKRFLPKYSVGYNFDFESFFNVIKKYKPDIESIYFPPPRRLIGSGRTIDEPMDYKRQIPEIISECKQLNITPFLLLNSTLISPGEIIGVVRYVKELNQNYGLNHVTVTDPYLMVNLRKALPSLFIEASTLCRVKNVSEARHFKELSVDRITTDREMIRDLKTLKSINKIIPLKVLANEGCMKNCIYKYAHYNMLSNNSPSEPFFATTKKINEIRKMNDEMDSLCTVSLLKKPYLVFQSPFIRPEDVKYYDGASTVFKLSTRNFDTKRIEKTLNAYTTQRYSGNLVDLLNTSYIQRIFEYIDNDELNKVDFFKKLSICNDDCDKCGFCKSLINTAKVKMKINSDPL